MNRIIGLYGGTFDPIHLGHLLLARDALEQCALERVYFIPCAQSPHKAARPLADPSHRLAMIRLAVRGEPGLAASDVELRRAGPSYAIETVAHFRKTFPDASLSWILGADQQPKLPTWNRFAELRKQVNFLFLPRAGLRSRSHVSRRVDLSATEIRDRVARHQSIRYLVPEPVRRHIERHGLYSQ